MINLLSYFHPLERIKRRREAYHSSLPLPNVISQLIQQPIPNIADIAMDLDYIVLDFETTGLDSKQDLILSMGWVTISQGKIDLLTAQHIYINDASQINPQTAVINHITPQMLAEGVSIHDAMNTFFQAAKGKIIVAHACAVEANFMNHYLVHSFHLPNAPLIWIDTLCIEKKRAKAINQDDDLDLILSGVRQRYNLPEYNSHNALADAVSTAELLLAINKRLQPNNSTTFGQLYKMSQ
ncbi:DNA polymerase III subunit epsilon [Vibrio sp. MACH09]|uniref:3'-5' exonuclease n=1 Tax=Vibrio sp. MACH09 TaxID=3025122 RepID=UPI00278EFE02|nr:3'-5' exonuclease [Vibrio sp. MACH09]GLO62586.1 DNA polymerase III subunit epsilon [Vibrio sp. MACH09]